jgi:hypothetical protein
MESFFHAGMVACKHELTYGLVGVERGTFDRFGVVDRDTYLQRLLWNFFSFRRLQWRYDGLLGLGGLGGARRRAAAARARQAYLRTGQAL